MDAQQFREFAKATVDYIADYIETVRDRDHPFLRQVLPDVSPGYLDHVLPAEAPESSEDWHDILSDMDRVIMPGVTHWASPQMHAFCPTGNSYPSIVGEMLTAGLSSLGFTWMSSPACTELEVVMMNWLGKLLGLPEEFLNCSEGRGGGVIQGSASEATFICLLAARECKVRAVKIENPALSEADIRAKLISYTSDQCNVSVEKAGLLAAVPMRLLQTDDQCRLRGDSLAEAIKEDRAKGLIPCYLVATLGTTNTCAFDDVDELGPVCKREGVWLHIDAAYAGTVFCCPEYRHLMKGIEYVESFNFDPHKWMLVNFDCSALWLRNSDLLTEAFSVHHVYLKHDHQDKAIDYRHWHIGLARRFRAIKLWTVLRCYGVEGIREHVRNHISLVQIFANLIRKDERFEVPIEPSMGLVCFRLRGPCEKTKALHESLMKRRNIYLVTCKFKDRLVLRFVVCSRVCEERDMEFAWNEISYVTNEILYADKGMVKKITAIPEIGKHAFA